METSFSLMMMMMMMMPWWNVVLHFYFVLLFLSRCSIVHFNFLSIFHFSTKISPRPMPISTPWLLLLFCFTSPSVTHSLIHFSSYFSVTCL